MYNFSHTYSNTYFLFLQICDINACKERIRLLKDLEKEKKEHISSGMTVFY